MKDAGTKDILRGYEGVSHDWIEDSAAISCEDLFVHVAEFLPVAPARVLDIGAGIGRVSAWLAEKGHQVTACEPVARFRREGQTRYGEFSIEWRDALLPGLESLDNGGDFDLILLVGVWQHVLPEYRKASLRKIRDLTGSFGQIVMSVRHGPGAPTRPVFPTDVEGLIGQAETLGLTLAHRNRAPSLQPGNRARGVEWTWLVLRAH